MFNTPAGNQTFDIPFLILQLTGLAFYILVIAKPKPFSPAIVRWTALFLIVAMPLLWAVAFPKASGIEGAARLILAVPLVAMNIMLAFAAYLRTRRR